MKKSNKIILITFMFIIIVPVAITLVRREQMKTEKPSIKIGNFHYQVSPLKKFNHLKIIGNDNALNSQDIYFSYDKEYKIFNREDNSPEMYSLTYNKDTLIIKLTEDKEYLKPAKLFSPNIHLFGPDLKSVDLEKITFLILKPKKGSSIDLSLNKSAARIKLQTASYKIDGEDIKQAYESINVKGNDSHFILDDVATDSLNLSLEGKSLFISHIPNNYFKYFKVNVSKETSVDIDKNLKKKVNFLDKNE